MVGFQDFEAEAVGVYYFAGFGNVASDTIEQASDCGGGGMLHAGVELDAEKFVDLVELNAATHYQRAAGLADYIRSGRAIFFADFADDFFDQIFHGDDAGHQAVFVNYDGHLLIFALHFLQEFGAEFCFRDEQRGTHQFADGAVRGVAVGDFEHVARHDDADDIVERFLVDREAGELGVHDQFAEFFE